MLKVFLALATGALASIVAAKVTYEASTYTGTEPVNQPWAQNSMKIVAWNEEKWTVWVRDGVFELRPQNQEDWSPHANTSLAYIDWEGEPWQAKINGDGFSLAYRGNWNGSTKRDDAIRYRDWTGRRQLRTLSQLRR